MAAWLLRLPLPMTPPGSRRVLVKAAVNSEILELPAANWRVLREPGWSRAAAAVWLWRGSSLDIAGSLASWKELGEARVGLRRGEVQLSSPEARKSCRFRLPWSQDEVAREAGWR